MAKHLFTVQVEVTSIGLVRVNTGGNMAVWDGVMPLQATTGVNTVSVHTIHHTTLYPAVCGRPTQVALRATTPAGIWVMLVDGGTGSLLSQATMLQPLRHHIRLRMLVEVDTTSL